MGLIGFMSGVPEQGNRKMRHGKRQRKAEHPVTQVAGVPFGNGGDEVGTARQGDGCRKAADDRYNPAREPAGVQGFVDRPFAGIMP